MITSGQKFGTVVKPSKFTNEFKYIGKKDRQMRFNTAQDPIYFIFDCIEDRPVSTLAKEFVKDSIFEVVNFVSKVVG